MTRACDVFHVVTTSILKNIILIYMAIQNNMMKENLREVPKKPLRLPRR